MTETDANMPDEHGLTDDARDIWRMYYVAITNMTQLAVTDSPTRAEAHRRVAILRLELAGCAQAIDQCDWDAVDAVAPTAPTPPTAPPATPPAQESEHGQV